VNVDRLLSVQRSSFEAATSSVRGGWPEADALGRDELVALIERHRYCVLATARADGRTHATPVASGTRSKRNGFAGTPIHRRGRPRLLS